MHIEIKNKTLITGLGKKHITEIKNRLTISNPLFYKKVDMNLYHWDTPQDLKYYETPTKDSILIPVGATNDILTMLRDEFNVLENEMEIKDERFTSLDHKEFFDNYNFTGTLRSYQKTAHDVCVDKTVGVVEAMTGSGKCLGKGTPVLMYSGEIKNVEDIKVGDLIMGPDSKPRKILSLSKGREQMYRINPTKGDSWECNASHILSLVYNGPSLNVGGGISHKKSIQNGDIVDISVKNYLNKTKSFQHTKKLFRVGVDFPKKPVTLDPYLLGVWIGDGTSLQPSITNKDKEVVDYLRKYASDNNYELVEKKYKNRTTVYRFNDPNTNGGIGKHNRNRLRAKLIDLGILGDKHIPNEYLINSRKTRLSLLAGLLDSDGHNGGSYYTITTKYEKLANQICYLCRSLGLAAYCSKKEGSIKSLDFKGLYYRVSISGDVNKIPCKIERKKTSTRQQKKDVLRTGFTVEALGEGDYYGFEIDGDRRFLLGDFTVTHNTVIFTSLTVSRKQPTLILVNTLDLADQTIEAISKFTNLAPEDVGFVGSGRFELKPISVGIQQTMTRLKDKDYKKLNNYFGQIIADEVHIVAAETFFNNMSKLDAKYKVGFSATPEREDGLTSVIHFACGPTIHKVPEEDIKKFITVPTYRSISTKYSFPLFDTQEYQLMLTDMAEDYDRNKLILETVRDNINNYNCLLCRRTSQVEYLAKQLGECAVALTSKVKKSDRPEIMRQIKDKEKTTLVSTFGLMSTGIDVPHFDKMYFCAPIKSKIVIKQSAGRLMRQDDDKESAEIIDFVDFGVDLLRHQFFVRKRIIDKLLNKLSKA